jgi:hypothetical protein
MGGVDVSFMFKFCQAKEKERGQGREEDSEEFDRPMMQVLARSNSIRVI